jgi:hypothetical protein
LLGSALARSQEATLKASFPTEFDAVLLGKSRDAGQFKADDGTAIEYPDAYELAFESSDGLAQTCRVSVKQLDEAADFDVAKTAKYTPLRVIGDVQVRDNGGFFKPTTVRLAKPTSAS